MFRIILSDLHLGRGKYRKDGSINPYEDFTDDEIFYEFLTFFSEGDYKKEEAEIIFNGDTFNIIQTAVEGSKNKLDITDEMVLEATEDTLNGHPLFFKSINMFFSKRKGGKVVFIAGNHDQPILHPEIQRMIKERIDANVIFAPLFYNFGTVHCEHGHNMEFIHRYDPSDVWYIKDRKKILKMPWGSYFVVQFIADLKEEFPTIDKVKPFGNFLKWGLFFYPLFTFKALLKMIKFYISNRFLHPDREHREAFKIDISSIIDGITHRNVQKYVSAIGKRGFKTVIMGHTHIPLECFIEGVHYLNSGTWLHMESLHFGTFAMKWKKTFVLQEERDGKTTISLKAWRGKWRERYEFY